MKKKVILIFLFAIFLILIIKNISNAEEFNYATYISDWRVFCIQRGQRLTNSSEYYRYLNTVFIRNLYATDVNNNSSISLLNPKFSYIANNIPHAVGAIYPAGEPGSYYVPGLPAKVIMGYNGYEIDACEGQKAIWNFFNAWLSTTNYTFAYLSADVR